MEFDERKPKTTITYIIHISIRFWNHAFMAVQLKNVITRALSASLFIIKLIQCINVVHHSKDGKCKKSE